MKFLDSRLDPMGSSVYFAAPGSRSLRLPNTGQLPPTEPQGPVRNSGQLPPAGPQGLGEDWLTTIPCTIRKPPPYGALRSEELDS